MKALFLLLCPLLLGLNGTVLDPSETLDQPLMQATVLNLTEDSALVEAQSGDRIRSGDQFTFPVQKLPAIGVGVGDTVRLTYMGFIQETWPAQIEVTNWQVITPATSPAPLTGQTPPALSLNYAGQTRSLPSASTTWTYDEGDGNGVTICGCGPSPLDSLANFPSMTRTNDEWVQLTFTARPDSVTIRCWPSSLVGQQGSNEQQALVLAWDGHGFSLPKGTEGLVIEIIADWKEGAPTASYGSASYIVSLSPAE